MLDERKGDVIDPGEFVPCLAGVDVRCVYAYDLLLSGEAMLLQGRFDNVYYDVDRTQLAFYHSASQFNFYQDGSLLDALYISRKIFREDGEPKVYSYFVGFRDNGYFTNEKRRAFVALPKAYQEAHVGKRELYSNADMA